MEAIKIPRRINYLHNIKLTLQTGPREPLAQPRQPPIPLARGRMLFAIHLPKIGPRAPS